MEVPFIEEAHLAGCKTLFELSRVLPEDDLLSAVALARHSNAKMFKSNLDLVYYDTLREAHMDPLYESLCGTSDTPANDLIAVLKGTAVLSV